jgi:hypothetical protein
VEDVVVELVVHSMPLNFVDDVVAVQKKKKMMKTSTSIAHLHCHHYYKHYCHYFLL